MYDSLHLYIFDRAADSIPRAQFPTPCALLEHYWQFFFSAVFAELVLTKDILGCVRSNNFESSPDRSSFVIRCDYPVYAYKESGRIEVVVSYLFC